MSGFVAVVQEAVTCVVPPEGMVGIETPLANRNPQRRSSVTAVSRQQNPRSVFRGGIDWLPGRGSLTLSFVPDFS